MAAGKTETFEAVARAWWNEIEPTLAANTHRGYNPAYERAVAEFGKMDVASITTKDIERYINQFAKTYAKKTVVTQRQIIPPDLKQSPARGLYRLQSGGGRPAPQKPAAEKAPRAKP